jgi:hypothetical protein
MPREFAPFTTKQMVVRGEKIDWKEVTIDLENDLKIGRDLQKQLRTSMSTYGWYAQLKEHAHAAMKQAEFAQTRANAKLYAKLREKFPKVTETQIKNKVVLHKRYVKCAKRLLMWQERFRMLDNICYSLKERNDNLRTLEATERRERDGKY